MRELIYDRLRRITSHRGRRWIKQQLWFAPLANALFGSGVYSKSYYDDIERLESDSMPHIADWICATIRPKSVLDVGCGSGHLMLALADRGVKVSGVDIANEAIRRVKEKKLDVRVHDLASDCPLLAGPYDLVVSCEVAEHLKEKHARRFVEKLVSVSKLIYLTAAEPDPNQGGGLFHFNEKPNEWWVQLFESLSYRLDIAATSHARQYLAANNVRQYLCKPMIFHASEVMPLGVEVGADKFTLRL